MPTGARAKALLTRLSGGIARHQVLGEDLHLVRGVVELLAIGAGKADHHPAVAFGLHAGNVHQQHRGRGRLLRVACPREAVDDIARRHRPAIMPAGARVEVECDGQRVTAGPAPGKLGHSRVIAEGSAAIAAKTQEDEVGDLHRRRAATQRWHDVRHRLPDRNDQSPLRRRRGLRRRRVREGRPTSGESGVRNDEAWCSGLNVGCDAVERPASPAPE